MNLKTLLVSAAAVLLLGCSATLQLFPVRGPLTQQNPVPTIQATITGPLSGTISFTLPGGEFCQGPWTSVDAKAHSQAEQPASGSNPIDLSSTWDEVFGAGYYVAKVVGVHPHDQARVTGNQGSSIQLDFLHNVPGYIAIGVAKDNHGNIYKIVY